MKIFGKIRTSGEFCKTNFKLFAQNFDFSNKKKYRYISIRINTENFLILITVLSFLLQRWRTSLPGISSCPNVGTHSVSVTGVGKIEDADFQLCQDGFGTNQKR